VHYALQKTYVGLLDHSSRDMSGVTTASPGVARVFNLASYQQGASSFSKKKKLQRTIGLSMLAREHFGMVTSDKISMLGQKQFGDCCAMSEHKVY
jgi:hypothetical protein